jgi:hypothetical protein
MTHAEMTDHTRKVAWVGPYHAGKDSTEVLVMADDAYTAILRHNTIASGAQYGAESWSTLVEQFGRDEVAEVLGPVISDVRHLFEDEDLDDSDEAMQKCLDAAKESDM